MDVSLSHNAEAIINRQLIQGYRSPDEVIEDALRLMDAEYERRLALLRQELIKGEESGEAVEYDLDMLEQLEQEALAELKAGNRELDPGACP